jgi:23S rRNA (guanosine2251-2'-O)-methyltransferase
MREWIGGRNPVYELLRAGRRQIFRVLVAQGVQEKGRISENLRLANSRKIPVEWAPRSRLDTLASGHQGVVVEASAYPYADLSDILRRAARLREDAFILVLDSLQDPQNLGSLLRTAEAVGVHGVLLPYRRTATVTPAVVSVSSGASEHMLIAQVNLHQGIQALKEAGLWIVGLERGPGAAPPNQIRLDGPLALVVGNEGEGMRALVRDSCDFLLQLPMRGMIDSLNAAVAGSVALYLAWQARRFAPTFSGITIDEQTES